MGWTAAAFAGAGLVLIVVTDAAQASLGLGGWASQIFGGFRPYVDGPYANGPYATSAEARRGWSWGAGVAFWSCGIGMLTCIAGWWLQRRSGSSSQNTDFLPA